MSSKRRNHGLAGNFAEGRGEATLEKLANNELSGRRKAIEPDPGKLSGGNQHLQ